LAGDDTYRLSLRMGELSQIPVRVALGMPLHPIEIAHLSLPSTDAVASLPYLDLIATSYAVCIGEIQASSLLADEASRNRLVQHHVKLAIDITGAIWRTFELYSCEGWEKVAQQAPA
jgi:hypothetical protein